MDVEPLTRTSVPRHYANVQGTKPPILRPTVWPAEPPALPAVLRVPARATALQLGWDEIDYFEYDVKAPEASRLEPDFVLREALEVDPADPVAVAAFQTLWGRLPLGLELLPPDEAQRAHMDVVMEEVAKRVRRPSEIGLADIAKWYLRALQAMARHWIAYAEGRAGFQDIWASAGFNRPPSERVAWEVWQRYLNAALSPFRMHIRLHDGDTTHMLHLPPPTLYSVAALQLAQLVAEGHVVRVCANDNCHNHFTRQRGRARYGVETHGYDTQKYAGVKYCSHRCAKAQSERDRRRRVKTGKGQS